MGDIDLTQAEADALMAMEKGRADDEPHEYPALGGAISVPLVSLDGRESFLLDVRRGRIDLAKGTYQNRARKAIILLRLDFGGRPHRNPDGEEIPGPHLHVFKEGLGDRWAMPAPEDAFPNTADRWQTLYDFMQYCNITRRPVITGGLLA